MAYVRDFISKNKCCLVALLETHVIQENATAISSFVAPGFTWNFNYDHHPGGRLWLGWDSTLWKLQMINCSSQHMSFYVHCIRTNTPFAITIVYGLHSYVERRALWRSLSDTQTLLHNSNPDIAWGILGDFNSYISPDESDGGYGGWSTSMLEFKNCIDEIGVTDLRSIGKRFTWWNCCISSPVYRKLDRVLVNHAWLATFTDSFVNFMPRGLSDHCPATISFGNQQERIYKPFQIFQHLIEDAEFLTEVARVWDVIIEGDEWFILTSKLKLVKTAMKSLNAKRGNLHSAVATAREKLLSFQNTMPEVPSLPSIQEESILMRELKNALTTEETLLKQKSKIHWLAKGDSNNKFFFSSCRGRWNSNKIVSMIDADGVEKTKHKDIANIAVSYFENILGTSKQVDPLLDDLELPGITAVQQDILCAPVTATEVLGALKSMPNNKCPGPDGFSSEFFIAAWSIVGHDVTRAILSFFRNLSLPRIINSTAIALIPKQPSPTELSHFRPISCCNTLYKCISKILSRRLKPLLNSVVSPSQSAFVSKRIIGDNIMLAQALCRGYHLTTGPPSCTIKLDITKAFDSINWDFLFAVLSRMKFPAIFISWIRKCVTSPMFSIKINGSLEGYFKGEAGLRQGDPLSPLLFILAMEVLTACIKKVTADPDFKYHQYCHQLQITHLIFADDVLLFSGGDLPSISSLLKAVRMFSNMSGLNPNIAKSSLFFSSVPDVVQNAVTSISGFPVGKLPITYLGIPLISSRLTTQLCLPLTIKLCARIDKWTNKFLSFAGRLQLLHSILYAIHGYWAMFLFLPKGVLKKVQGIMSNFLWGGSPTKRAQHKVAWMACCKPLEEGGLGLKNIYEWNQAAIFYQIWRIVTKKQSLWMDWFRSQVLKSKSLWEINIPVSSSWCVRKILSHRLRAIPFLNYNIGASSDFSFWHDPWANGRSLFTILGSEAISAVVSTHATKASHYMDGTTWKPPDSNHVLAIEVRHFLSLIPIGLSDSITWDGNESAKLSTIWDCIRSRSAIIPWAPLIWHPWIPKKFAFISWLALQDKLLTRDRMMRFGMTTDTSCLLCASAPETVDHLFTQCPFLLEIMAACPYDVLNDWNSYVQGHFSRLTGSRLKLCMLFLTTAIYFIWRERNNRLHGKTPRCSEAIVLDMKSTIRCKLTSCRAFQKAAGQDRDLISALF